MKHELKRASGFLRSPAMAFVLWIGCLFWGAVWLPGCGSEGIVENLEPENSSFAVGTLWAEGGSIKLDILLSIDNSRSMKDKQELLQLAVPDLVRSLVNPVCIDQAGVPTELQPNDASMDCPTEGSRRVFEPIQDIHIGVITSSLGSYGADTCDANVDPSANDRARLIDRKSTSSSEKVTTWDDKGFLVWDPNTSEPSHVPQGETDESSLIGRLREMVAGAGEVGCGFEAQLESWYRFLIEPDPYETITVEDGQAILQGRDEVLLQQRREFLRPDSLLAIIMLSDENDCSIRAGGQYFLAAQRNKSGTTLPYLMPKPRAACATDPNSPCCRSCSQDPGDGCDTSMDDCNGSLAQIDDQLNLRCFDQKRRFGVDFLYPIDRYVSGLSSPTVMDRQGNVVPNPIFSDLKPEAARCGGIRDSSLVFLTGIVGVPWQDIARRDADGKPSLLAGLDSSGRPVGGFQTASEMNTLGTWDIILGDPSQSIEPKDPLMVESIDPRSGKNPVTGDAMQPPDAAEGANPINGHEASIPDRNDLQHACTFPLQTPRDCSLEADCDCSSATPNHPLCDPSNPQVQKYGKAYPSLRELAVIRGLGGQGAVASACPEQQTNPALPNFGYRQAMASLIRRVSPVVCGACFGGKLTTEADGQVRCRLIEARTTETCDCGAPGRAPLSKGGASALQFILEQPFYAYGKDHWKCFCEVPQATGNALVACQNEVNEPVMDLDGAVVDGWCYIDADNKVGNPALVAGCPANERRDLRLVGAANPRACSSLLLACVDE